ncbi:retinitis pigmentosa 9 protein isoform X2 [Stegostoma tigrinum]|uniref:retinitis pigmentosa 9 protein isoform X2 n=1 Tax=Stegostoma tigrinum TaxID=3053191 RepID=UPI00202ACFE7|nr:retinitis pigmentosa 9 protein isoform X2 [Stegostoma tigrinum]
MAEDSRASAHERRHYRRKRHAAEEKEPERRKKKRLHQEVKKLKHVETFYEKPPPGMIKENDDKPEDCIPDLPGNEEARDFLAHAPTKGLWMPLGKEVKVMQCWRCKNFGHRTGDRECPYFISGNQKLEQFRVAHEDPMYDLIRENKRIQQLKQMLEDTTSDSNSSSSSDSGDRHKKKKKRKEKRRKKEKKKRKKHKSRKSSDSSE